MPAAKQYVAVHDFTTRINDDTGEEKSFKAGDLYDGPPERLEVLMDQKFWPDTGPLVAAKSSDEAKQAEAAAKQDEKPTAAVAGSELKGN